MWLLGGVMALATASLSSAATSRIDGAADVGDRAERLTLSYEEDLTPEERAVTEMVTLVNIERGNRGLPFLHVDDQVEAAALAHAADMAAMRQMRHLGSDGSDAGVRLERAGYVWTAWGENIGAGFLDPAPLVAAWLSSPEHRKHLLGDFQHIGVGAVATADGVPYWSLVVANAPLN